MHYNIKQDLTYIEEILGLTREELFQKLKLNQNFLLSQDLDLQKELTYLEKIYNFAFENNIRLGKQIEMLHYEKILPNHKLLAHGSKSEIEGKIDLSKARVNNDFGQGFYAGESYDQSVSFICGFPKSCVYFLDLNPQDLKCRKYNIDQDWMLTIAFYRGSLNKYKNHPLIKNIISSSRNYDYIIAPIADNRMYQVINSFIYGEITDEQCKQCLAATNLGNQYVFLSEKSIEHLYILERRYISNMEKEHYISMKTNDLKLGEDKVKIAKIQYRGKGKYIDELLKEEYLS